MEIFIAGFALLCAMWAAFAEVSRRGLRKTNSQFQAELEQLRKAEEEFRLGQTKVRAILDAVPDVMTRISHEGILLELLTKPRQGSGLTTACLGQAVEAIYPSTVAARYRQAIAQTIGTGRLQVFHYEIEVNGRPRGREVRITSCDEALLVIERDTTENAAMEKQLRYLSLYDPLTGLFNRARFEQEMRRLNCDEAPVGMVVCDMDGLKLINDALGHEQGDKMLIAVAEILKRSFRAEDIIARIGGDEFAILMPKAEPTLVQEICQQIRQTVDEYNSMLPGIRLGVSVGHAVSDSVVDMNALFQDADNQMYRQKLLHGDAAAQFILDGMFQAIESRDHFNRRHPERLLEFSLLLAEALHLGPEKNERLKLLARYHDIGKVGIDERIIMKPGQLSSEEMREITRHSEVGSRIARCVPEIAPIADLILKHHEHWDGGGYPLGLKQKAIPVECRILAIADAYEVMTAGRPYSPAKSSAEAIDELLRGAGRQFDPALLNLFVRALESRPMPVEEG